MMTNSPETSPTPGQIIRQYRESMGFTPAQMAKILYCSVNEISSFENDSKHISKLKRVFWSSIIPEWTPDMLKTPSAELQ